MTSRVPRFLPLLAAGAVALAAFWGLRVVAGDGQVNQVLPFGEVNWQHGYVKVSAIGLPPFGASGARTPEEVARQNAVSLAQRRLLGVILDLPAGDRPVRDHLTSRPELKDRLRALVSAAAVTGKTYSDGSVEITLTLQMEGTSGLKAFLGGL